MCLKLVDRFRTDLRDRLERIELRVPSVEAKEMLDDQGEDHWQQKNLALVRSWPEKLARTIGKAVAKKVGDDALDLAADAIMGVFEREQD